MTSALAWGLMNAQDIAATLARERELDAKLALGHDGSDVMAKRMLKEWREEQELLRAEQLKVISEMVSCSHAVPCLVAVSKDRAIAT